jgi:cytidine deaminase
MVNPERYAELLATARKMFERAHAPYSKYRVGAALLSKDGQVFVGCNVETCTFEGSICAERTAMTAAIAAGCRELEAIAVACEQNLEVWPCGVCRQFLAEFGLDLIVVVGGADGKSIVTRKLSELLPYFYPPSEVLNVKVAK